MKKQFEYEKDRPKKDRIRDELINCIKKYNVKKILILESPKFEIVKRLPNIKFLVYEKNYKTYMAMQKTKTKFKNIYLTRGNVANFKSSKLKADVIYLDFCGTFSGEKDNILALKDKIKVSKFFIVTFSPHEPRQKFEGISNFYLSIAGRLQRLLDMRLDIVFGEDYYDTCPMVTIGFEPKINNLEV